MKDPLARSVLLRNAAANIATGLAGAFLAVVLPPFLVRRLDRDSYSVWVLLLQIGGYVGILSLGLQTAVAHFVAAAETRPDGRRQSEIVSTAVAILGFSALVGFGAIAILGGVLGRLFPGIPQALRGDAELALIVVGGSLALGLPLTAVNGVFTGIQRNEVSAAITVLGRLATGICLVVIADMRAGITPMAFAFCGVNLLTYSVQWGALRRFVPGIRAAVPFVSPRAFRDLVAYGGAITVWSVSMLLVSGLDLALVARFDFAAVGAFGIAAGLLAVVQGAQAAVLVVLMPAGASLDAGGATERIGRLVRNATRWNLLAVGSCIAFYSIVGHASVRAWVGPEYAGRVAPLLDLLLIAAAIRLSMAPFTTLAVGVGDHGRIILGPVTEALTNLVASIVLGSFLGAIGVALGTLIGGIVGVAFHVVVGLKRCPKLGLVPSEFRRTALFPSMLAVMPVLVVLAAGLRNVPLSLGPVSVAGLIASTAFALLAWSVVLVPGERASLLNGLRAARGRLVGKAAQQEAGSK